MRKLIISTMAFIFSAAFLCAQESGSGLTLDQEYIVESKPLINDYTMIGVNYGVTFSNMYFSPSKHNRSFVVQPNYVSVTYTRHCKMFDNLPYFAFVGGIAMGNEGFAFEVDSETGTSADVDGATWCSMKVFEVPVMAQIHLDQEPFKIMINAGIYGGWRQSISRTGPGLDLTYANTFRDYEHQIDYGFQGGAGIGFIFAPFELHFNCTLRWSWSNLYDPDYASSYYYYYAYPLDIIASVGLHFHLTKRNGKTKRQLKLEAYDYVYGTSQNNSGQNR